MYVLRNRDEICIDYKNFDTAVVGHFCTVPGRLIMLTVAHAACAVLDLSTGISPQPAAIGELRLSLRRSATSRFGMTA